MAETSHQADKKNIQNEILEYLSENPEAADSVEGIAMWWVSRKRIEASVLEVQKTLDSLVLSGIVNKSEGKDGSVIYSLARQ